jgi:arsenate reductase-like glutaredoxin family protein
MLVREVIIYTDTADENLERLKNILSDAYIKFRVFDLKKDSLEKGQLNELLRHFDLRHFIRDNGNGSRKLLEDYNSYSRSEILEKLANDHSLINGPIIVAGRLMTVGYHWETISQILYLDKNGKSDENDEARPKGKAA